MADVGLEISKSHRFSNKVAIVKGERSIETVMKALDLIGGVNEFFDKPILIKVNLIASKTWDRGVTTDPIVVEALIKAFKEVNDDVFVIESDATMTNADKAAKICGILDVCEKYSVPFVNLKRLNERLTIKLEEPETLSRITLPKFILGGYIISAAKMKTHVDTQVTLGMKNMFGLIPEKFKSKYHLMNSIDKVIVDVNTVIKPVLTIIDGFIAMEGQGPIDGNPVKMNLIIAGKDVVATDAVASRVMGFDPRLIYHIRRSSEKGLGAIEGYEIVGENVESVSRRFKRP
ncbi:MAG: DUF362 domain-containing protein [archaeon]|nr:DUF362 domain-containing protein [archaeon]